MFLRLLEVDFTSKSFYYLYFPYGRPPTFLSLSSLLLPPTSSPLMDIFDEEDLLAIANDGGSSCSSHDSSDASSVASDICDEGAEIDGDVKAEVKLGSEAASDEKDDDSDDSDGGFLDSWLTDMKKSEDVLKDELALDKSRDCAREEKVDVNAGKADGNAAHLQDNVANNVSKGRLDASNTRSVDDKRDTNTHPIELGSSVLGWISNRSSKKSKAGGVEIKDDAVIGITRKQDPSAASLWMELIKNPSTDRMHSKDIHATIIESVSNEGSETQYFRGDATICKSDDRRKSMVDCLAIYDDKRKCYVLELVDMFIPNLKQMDQSTQDLEWNNNQSAVDVTTTDVSNNDPRLLARRAEAQVKKLKRGKRKSVGEGGNKKGKVEAGINATK
jgi:hypothetical protein